MDYQINGNCSITAAVRNASHLIELDFFHFCDFCVCFWQLPSVCLGPALLISHSDWDRGLFSSNCFSPPLSLSISLSLSPSFSFSSLAQTIVMEIIKGAKTTNKRKSFNVHLSQKEQNCSLIMTGTIKTVHIYWQGTSHSNICSWIPKNEGRISVWWWMDGRAGGIAAYERLYDGAALKTCSFAWQMETFLM